MIRRTAGRLSVVGLTIVMLAAPAPASASPSAGNTVSPNERSASAATTVCTAVRSGFSAATGSCQNPASHLSFRVIILCRHWATGDTYVSVSPLASTFDTVHHFCAAINVDPILDWDTQIVVTGDPPEPPVIHSLTCEPAGFSRLACSLSASGWTQIRWTVNGRAVSRWNNATSIHGSCLTGLPSILIEVRDIVVKVAVSNSDGTTRRQTSVRCVVTG